MAVSSSLPPWLADDSAAPQEATDRASAPQAEALPPWLADGDDSAASDAPPPPWLAELQQSAPAEAPAADDLPDWLRSEAAASPPADAADVPADELPDWLREIAPPTPSAAAPPSNAVAPGWNDDADQPVKPHSKPQGAAADGLPDWLDELEPATPEPATPAPQPAPPAVEATPTPSTAGDELPDWLQEYTAQPPAPPAAAATDELPPWLRDDEAVSPPSEPAEVDQSATGDELPAWLASDDQASSAEAAPPAEDTLPPWLADEAAAAPAPEASAPADLPPWLADEAGEAAAQPTGETTPSWLTADEPPAATTRPASDASDLPPWLMDDSETVAAAPDRAPAAANGDRDRVEEASPAETDSELPPWLRDEEAAGTAASPQPGAAGTLPAWLVEESPTAAPISAERSDETPAPAEADALPAWLSEDLQAAAASGAAPSAETDELPAWLRDTDEVSGIQSPQSSADPGTTQALPAWLLEEAPTTAEAPSIGDASDTDEPSELPAWLQSAETSERPVEPTADAASEQDLPAWLQEPEPTALDQIEPTATPVDATGATAPVSADVEADADLPTWLSDEGDATSAVIPAAEPPAAAPETPQDSAATVELPAWLEDATPDQPIAAQAASSGDLPPWLADLPADAPAAETESAVGLPAWLDEPAEETAPSAAEQRGNAELVSGLELPAWLREETAATAGTTETKPAWLDRVADEGGDEATAVSDATATTPAPRVVRSPERIAAMQLLDQLKEEPVSEPAPSAAERRFSWVTTVLLPVVALLLIAALLYILLNNRINFGLGAAAPAAPVAAAAGMLSALPANQPVVLAYEWEAQRLGDLGPLEDVVLAELTRRTDLPLVLLSTDPQGALLANARASRLAQLNNNFHNRYGLGYVNLGFRPGGEVALRRMASGAGFGDMLARDAYGNDLQTNEVTLASVCGAAADCGWQNVGLLVLMADDVADVRGWFEQVRSAYPDLPVLVLASREIAPQIQPYVTDSNVQQVAGIAGAEALARAAGVPSERYGRQLDATSLGGAAFALLVLFGGVPAMVMGWRMRRDGTGAKESGPWAR